MKISNSPLLIAEQLSEFVAELSIETIPFEVIDEARRCMLDTTDVIIAGQSSNVALNTRIHAKSVYGSGKARIFETSDIMHPIASRHVLQDIPALDIVGYDVPTTEFNRASGLT